MRRTCPDCEGLKDGSRSTDEFGEPREPHEYLVSTGRSKGGGAVFYKCLLCNTFLTFVSEEGAPRWNPGFRPHDAPAPGRPAAN